MLSSTLLDDGLGNISLVNDDDSHTITLSAYISRVFIYEDGVSLGNWPQSYVKSLSVDTAGGNDSVVLPEWHWKYSYQMIGAVINGGDGDDSIQGTHGNDTINAGAGNDSVWSALGSDTILGGDGDDYFTNTDGSSDFSGGLGSDTMDCATVINPMNVTLDNVKNDSDGRGGTDNFRDDIETIYTGNLADVVVGSSGDNVFYTGKGNDIVYAGAGNDVIYDGLGSDKIYGEAGNDLFVANATEALNNKDSLYGGDGDDVFFGYGDLYRDVIDGGAGIDTVEGTDALDLLTNVETII
ncbi:MAG TPA: calcium-binding protein [Tepidisphaeraceae bacterium]